MGLSVHLPTLIMLSAAINLMVGGLLWALACGAFAIGKVFAFLKSDHRRQANGGANA
tara:strand:+ start:2114 stop:2284 length:171 start_codon:yes stop_codon:yes gene_type:complete